MGELTERVQHLFTTALDVGDIDGYLSGFGENCIVRALGHEFNGQQAFRGLLTGYLTAFSENRHTVIGSVETADCVAVELTWTARHTGPLSMGGLNLESTGKLIEWTLCEWDWFSDDKIVRSHIYADQAQLAGQLGIGG
ncbi:ester cyclase [Mycobacterium sp.]|uniref:ester cyclase n=1 Tax=Mycobacterium sp. TaxID=1785 RepID=UPI003BB15DF8